MGADCTDRIGNCVESFFVKVRHYLKLFPKDLIKNLRTDVTSETH